MGTRSEESTLYLWNKQTQNSLKFQFLLPWEQLRTSTSQLHFMQLYIFSKHTLWPTSPFGNSPGSLRYHFDSLYTSVHFLSTTTSLTLGSFCYPLIVSLLLSFKVACQNSYPDFQNSSWSGFYLWHGSLPTQIKSLG